ncbi:MAG: hypothetical protein HY423_16760 [Candidatus Lambdaproteobacteria bacterium]|nr:hypothetical protein [Candidatus Lambdaproteobacteria bacterium]
METSSPQPRPPTVAVSRWVYRFGIVLVFVLGLAIGSAGTWWAVTWQFGPPFGAWRGERGPRFEPVMERLTRRLGLSDRQRQEIEPIVRDVHLRMMELRRRLQPEVWQTLDDGMQRIRPHLTEAQRERADRQFERMHNRFRGGP